MKTPPLPKVVKPFIFVGLSAISGSVGYAQWQMPRYFAPGGGDRAGTWDTYAVLGGAAPQGAEYHNIDATGLSADVSIDTYFRGGVGVGYNLNQFWNVNFELLLGAPDFQATTSAGRRSASDTVYIGSGKLNVDWNILPGKVTPLISTGIGFVTLTVDDPYQEPVCYPDYWWGYVCYESTRTEAAFTWNVGGGIRWDIGKNVFLKAVAWV
ncbi:MAG TPA: outer membrane beta-barrel protein, partial [Verrucomicrobiota bacterium]|nr:hypothetical protein [Verrucomicrobiales bacterium]HRI16854.1 outer membrane beta-barrel protein [Verrucomicrobiota bacterium]